MNEQLNRMSAQSGERQIKGLIGCACGGNREHYQERDDCMRDTVIVTGAAGGFGRAICSILTNNKYDVVACDRDPELLEELKKEFESIKIFVLDTSNYSQVQTLFRSIDQFSLVGLVNNVGICLGKNLADYSVEEINNVMAVNLKSTIFFSQFFESHKKLHDASSIVNISSVAAHGGYDPVYAASKAAIVGFTKACAITMAPRIRVNAICPGIVRTGLTAQLPKGTIEKYLNRQLLTEEITTDDIANTVEFLISKKSKAYTGAAFELNAGGHL